MRTISSDIEETIKLKEDEHKISKDFEILENANKNFNELVKKGIITPRGYNLMSIEDNVISNFEFNKDKSIIQCVY